MEGQIPFEHNSEIELIGEEKYIFEELRRRIREEKQTFLEKISEIKTFVQNGATNQWRRALACGICWVPSGIAINSRTLCSFLKMSNSDLNRSLNKIGYVPSAKPLNELFEVIPVLEADQSQAREWSIKAYSPVTPQPILEEELHHSKSYTFSSPNIEETSLVDPTSFYSPKQMIPASSSIDVLSFFDDPFCCLPVFLVEDMQKAN
ncbi:potassium/sodium hyperpolarization-activated cyclic nucleotide-gated channel 1 [Histomonas meleagridis]|uniref:potassium/sodium hyperpolarization-activated cyclic nucleotide-gated channel 1 n=1 Tax=Histomonas meleagridis TaxID=135588 RepID=UPI00355A2AFD|nr:potassium/sodium hyperpolarization-activated cyclic nucleotide-gated channel 1 [Histomonas meleagridis]KAH0802473.1 potassium/sodium hyperpolarization-activated cyclic nucleotide-gated channel 1 [Histomonas meleagridis]